MSILNVVQPDELDGSTFAITDGKVKAAISTMPDNLLQSKSDGLFAGGSEVGIPNRHIYNIKPGEYLEHEGIKFDLYVTEGAVSGHVYGNRIANNGIVNFHDAEYHEPADGSISLPWGLERYPRFIIRVDSLTGEPIRDIFVVRVLMSDTNDYLISVIIDEMITTIHPDDEDVDGDSGGGTDTSTLYESAAFLRFPAIGKTATFALGLDNTLSLFSSDFAGNIDTSVNYIDQEQPYAKTLNGLFVWDQNAHVAAWVGDNKRVYLARFDTITIVPVITELGESINDYPWLEIGHTSGGDVYISEKASNTGLAINVWKVDINNSKVVPYFKESIRDETATFEGEHLCGNRLVAFESPVDGSGLRFRAVNVVTNESLVSSEVPYFTFADCLIANLTGNIFVVINKLFADGTRVLMVTINDTEIIVKDTGVLPLLNVRTLTYGPLSAGVSGDGSSVVNFYASEDGVSYIFGINDLNGEIGLSRQQVTSGMIQGAGIVLQEGLPSVVFTSSNTAYIQHDLRLSSFKTFPLNMEKYDNSPKAVSLSATWNESYGMINVSGRLANTNPTTWTYAHLEVETPSGQIHTAKYRIGTTENGLVERNLWAIAEPGEYIFRLRPWDGGDTVEARAIVPSEGKDFRAPIVTPTGDGEWVFSTENTEAGERGVYNVYRSRHPVSIIEDFDRDGYVYDNIHTTLKKYRIPTEERNGVWYIIVGHSGVASETIWTPTFFTYGEE